jgi:putative aldouronate transport system substrate-binding protein
MSRQSNAFFRVVSLIVALVLLVSGCAQGAAPSTPSASPKAAAQATPQATTPAAPATKPAEKPVDIELWFGASATEAGPPPEDWVAYKQIREKLNINLKLVAEPSSVNDQDAKITAAGAANKLPDVFMVNHDALYRLVQQGLVAPVDSLLPLMPERTKTHYNDAERNKLATWGGVLYGMPDPGTLPHIDGLVVRKDWLDKLNLKAPKTLDEFLTVAKAFTEKDPDGNGKADSYGYCGYLEGTGLVRAGLGTRFDWIFGAYGAAGVWNLDNTSFGLNVRNPSYMKGIQFVKQMVDAKVIDPGLAHAQERGVPRPLEAGQVRHDARELRRPLHRGQLRRLR